MIHYTSCQSNKNGGVYQPLLPRVVEAFRSAGLHRVRIKREQMYQFIKETWHSRRSRWRRVFGEGLTLLRPFSKPLNPNPGASPIPGWYIGGALLHFQDVLFIFASKPSHHQSSYVSKSTVMTHTQVIHAYRHLYRAGLRAVCYSQPARTSFRDLLRGAFRSKDAQLDERALKRTLWFLKAAGRELGMEHKIVRNMLMVQYWKQETAKREQNTWSQIVMKTTPKKTYVSRASFHLRFMLLKLINSSGVRSRTQPFFTMKRPSIC